jgi:hypothetical protein
MQPQTLVRRLPVWLTDGDKQTEVTQSGHHFAGKDVFPFVVPCNIRHQTA